MVWSEGTSTSDQYKKMHQVMEEAGDMDGIFSITWWLSSILTEGNRSLIASP
jgi:hypothetical protein